MPKQISSTAKSFWKFGLTTKIIGGVVILAVIGGVYISVKSKQVSYQYVAVQTGSISETVSVTGNTTPTSSVSLGFGSSGTIASVSTDVGQTVSEGQVLARLNSDSLNAETSQLQADADAEKAKLQELEDGTRPEQLSIDQQSADNADAALMVAMNTAYEQTNDAILNKSDALFTNGDSATPTIKIATESWDQQRDIQDERLALRDMLTKWQTDLNSGDIATAKATSDQSLQAAKKFIDDLNILVGNLSDNSGGLSQTQINSYNTAISSAGQEISTADSAEQSAESADNSAQDSLTLAKAGSTPQDIQAEQAQVESAAAAVQSSQAKYLDSEIVAPISGQVTQFDAKVGEFASPGTPLVSIISAGQFEIDALVSETDIGKIAIGNDATMTLDAFPNETFNGSVFYIDPAQTTSEGVVGYKIKVAFATPDPRMKSGLTVNLDIQTRHKDGVLLLPQYAILQNDSGTFVEVLQNGKVVDVPVVLGLQDESGNVEIVSGVTAGEQVINIGLKQK